MKCESNWILHERFCVLIDAGVEGGPNERKLLDDLLLPYNILERPVASENETLQVSFGLTLMQIIDVVRENPLTLHITFTWPKKYCSPHSTLYCMISTFITSFKYHLPTT
jgi:hypothetical protein